MHPETEPLEAAPTSQAEEETEAGGGKRTHPHLHAGARGGQPHCPRSQRPCCAPDALPAPQDKRPGAPSLTVPPPTHTPRAGPHLHPQDGFLTQPDGLQVLLRDLRKDRLLLALPHAISPVKELFIIRQLSKRGPGTLPATETDQLARVHRAAHQAEATAAPRAHGFGHRGPPGICRAPRPHFRRGDDPQPQGLATWGHYRDQGPTDDPSPPRATPGLATGRTQQPPAPHHSLAGVQTPRVPSCCDTREMPPDRWTQTAPHRAGSPPQVHSGGGRRSRSGSSRQAGAVETEVWPPTQQGTRATGDGASRTHLHRDWTPGEGCQGAFYVFPFWVDCFNLPDPEIQ